MSAIRQARALMRVQWRENVTYRVDFVIDLVGSLIAVAVYYFLWRAVFLARPGAGGLDLAFMVSYIVLVQIVEALTDPPDIARALAAEVTEGSVVLHLLRPYSLQLRFLAQTLAAVGWRIGWVVVPLVFVGVAASIRLPTPGQFGWFLLSLPLALAVNLCIATLVGLGAFWLRQNEGLVQVRLFAQEFSSGALVPLVLFPGPLAQLAEWLPFRAVVDVPLGLYLGYHRPDVLLGQAGWAIGLWTLTALVFNRARRKLVILGG